MESRELWRLLKGFCRCSAAIFLNERLSRNLQGCKQSWRFGQEVKMMNKLRRMNSWVALLMLVALVAGCTRDPMCENIVSLTADRDSLPKENTVTQPSSSPTPSALTPNMRKLITSLPAVT